MKAFQKCTEREGLNYQKMSIDEHTIKHFRCFFCSLLNSSFGSLLSILNPSFSFIRAVQRGLLQEDSELMCLLIT